ncbi:MAG: IS66 family transposase [Burkholderiales bacterium]
MAELEALVEKLQRQLQELTQPPSGSRPAPQLPPGPRKKPTGRRPGGQAGHPPHLKQLLPAERVKHTISYVPEQCDRCGAALPAEAGPDDPPPARHQVAELPPLAAEITEHQGQARTCARCGTLTRAPIPADIRAHSVGDRLTALLSYLVGVHGVSKRGVEEIAEAVFEAPVSLGTVANLEQEMSVALATAHQEAVAAVQQAPVKHADETGWKQAGRKRWLWVAATAGVVAFVIHRLRNVTALRQLLGVRWRGILCSDRWRAYDQWPLMQRQVCWAHLKRNWEKLLERGGAAQRIGAGCLSVSARVFEQWHLFRGGGRDRRALDDAMSPLMLELLAVLEKGQRSRDAKLARFCRRLADVYPALWTFVVVEGVEPTNNHAERVQRRAVLWRRRSFGCHSEVGCRFVERILTVVQTLRQQQRSVLQFLYEAIAAHRSGHHAPRLVMAG